MSANTNIVTARPADEPIRVLIADDHPVVREGLAAVIGRRPNLRVVGVAAGGRTAVELYRAHSPDVCLLDLRMPDLGAVEVIEEIRRDFPRARFIIVTTFSGDADIYRALRAGAQAYLLKDAEPEALVEAVEAVHAGERRIPEEVAAKLAMHVSSPTLTPREHEVLERIVAGRTNLEIATELFISEATVKGHVTNLLAKLDATDRAHAAAVAIRRGLIHVT